VGQPVRKLKPSKLVFAGMRLFCFLTIFFSAFALAETPEEKIDALIEADLKRQGLQPNPKIDDAAFLRRSHLNIAGRIPTIEEAEEFHSSEYPNKRERLIQQLLDSDAHVSHFYNYWADVLRMQDQGPSRNAFLNYQLWLKKSIKDNLPYDDFVSALVSSRGKTWESGAMGYYFRDRGMPLDNMSNTVRIFLGTRLECAQCHNHPFDKWTQMDYYQMAAFSYGMDARDIYTYTPLRRATGEDFKQRVRDAFAEAVGPDKNIPMVRPENMEKHISVHAGRPRSGLGGEDGIPVEEFKTLVMKGWEAVKEIDDLREGAYWASVDLYYPLLNYTVAENEVELNLPHDYQYQDAKPGDVIEASTMFGGEIDLANYDGSPIEAYTDWMTSRDNPTFTRVIANRLWKLAFGVAVIEPVDDFTDLAQPSNPELMAYLEDLMRELDFDMRAYLKIVFNTEAWQRSANREQLLMGQPYHFAGPALRRMSAEQIWDSMVALAVPEADLYRPLLKTQLQSVERERLLWESLEGRSIEDLTELLETLAPLTLARRRGREKAAQEMIVVHRAGDKEKLAAIRQAEKDAETELRNTYREVGYIELVKASSGEQLLGSMMGLAEAKMTSMDGSVAGGAVLTSLPEIKLPEMPADLKPGDQHEWTKRQQADLRTFKGLIYRMARASELETPAKRGHFLRDFGQSDREVIENAAATASVPQALNLLNGPMIEALTNKFAVFGRRLAGAETQEEKTRLIFGAMLTREPTEAELELVAAEVEKFGDEAYDGVVWALLNTQQFLFVE
jgi:hypothetical protein